MKISETVYSNLSPIERVRAAISAMARNDDAELITLKETCPKRAFLITEPGYAERMPLIMAVLQSVEYDLLECLVHYLISRSKNSDMDSTDRILKRMATLHAGLRLFSEAQGIDCAELEATGPPRHPAVAYLLECSEGEEDAHEAAVIADELLKIVAQES